MKFINVGFGNMVAADRVVALANPDSAPIKRLIQDSKDDGRAIDVTCGRRTRAVIITDSEHVILSAIQTETIANRLDDRDVGDDEEPAESSEMTNTKPLDATIEGVAAAEDAAMEVTTVVNMSTQTEELPVLETAAAVGDLFDDED